VPAGYRTGGASNLAWLRFAQVTSLSFHPSGSYLLTGSTDTKLKVATEPVSWLCSGHDLPLSCCCTQVWDLVEGRLFYTLRSHEGPVTACAFSPSGDFFASAGDVQALVWRCASSHFLLLFWFSPASHALLQCLSPDSPRIVRPSAITYVRVAALISTSTLSAHNSHFLSVLRPTLASAQMQARRTHACAHMPSLHAFGATTPYLYCPSVSAH